MEFHKILLKLMKDAEELGGQGTEKKKWVLTQLGQYQWMSEDTYEIVSEIIDLIILIDKHQVQIHKTVSRFCFFV